jgi:hypothetical protein
MGTYVVATGEAADGHIISFHSQMMSPLLYSKTTSSKIGKHHAML